MKRALLSYVQDIPAGAVVEVATLASALNIPPRHVAHILARLSDDEAEMVPRHRVIPRDGRFSAPRQADLGQALQMALLAQEGVPFFAPGRIDMREAARWAPPDRHRNTFWADFDGE